MLIALIDIMSPLSQLVESLQIKISKLLQKHNENLEEIIFLKTELNEKTLQINTLQEELLALENKYRTLKIANTMLGSDNNKRETKFKINTLIKDIDHCISQLSK